jgi:hypothetical protein
MDNLDVFESVFRRALRSPYLFTEKKVERALLITDIDAPSDYAEQVRKFVGVEAPWSVLGKSDYSRWADLSAKVDAEKPDFIATYRLLQEDHENRKFSLGAYLDTLAQSVQVPVLVLPDPALELPTDRDSVMVVTNHLDGEHELVHWAVACAQQGATINLCHLEDADSFDYYLHAIGEIPEINTDVARETLRNQLLARPRQYIESVQQELGRRRPDLSVRSSVAFGHVIDHYRSLLKEKRADLLLFKVRDETQLAMHSIGYSLAVEFKDTPLLLI